MTPSFERDGYSIQRNVFSSEEVKKMVQAFESLERYAAEIDGTTEKSGSVFFVEGDRIDRVCWCGAAEPLLLEVGRDERLLEIVREGLQSTECDHLINQAHFKLPGDGVTFPWHQDSQHRRYGTDLWTDVNGQGSFIQIGVAVDEANTQNGCLYVFPGSHKLGHIGIGDRPISDFGFKEKDAVPVELEPGDLLFFGPYLVHGSFENLSSKPRRVLINGYSYPGANKREYPGVAAGERISLI